MTSTAVFREGSCDPCCRRVACKSERERHSGPTWFAVVAASLALLHPMLLHAQSHAVRASPKIMEVLDTVPLDIKDENTQLIKLKKMRFNVAVAEAKERFALFKKGQTRLTDLVDVGQRVLTAQADLAQSPEERARS